MSCSLLVAFPCPDFCLSDMILLMIYNEEVSVCDLVNSLNEVSYYRVALCLNDLFYHPYHSKILCA